MVWRVPYPTGGPPVPALRDTAHAKPKASRSQRRYFLFILCRPCSCGDRRVDFAYEATSFCTLLLLSELPLEGPVREGETRM